MSNVHVIKNCFPTIWYEIVNNTKIKKIFHNNAINFK